MACEQEQQEIDKIESYIESLHESLETATSSEKPGINAKIEQAQARLSAAQHALAECESRQKAVDRFLASQVVVLECVIGGFLSYDGTGLVMTSTSNGNASKWKVISGQDTTPDTISLQCLGIGGTDNYLNVYDVGKPAGLSSDDDTNSYFQVLGIDGHSVALMCAPDGGPPGAGYLVGTTPPGSASLAANLGSPATGWKI